MNILFNKDLKEFYGEQSDKFYSLINSALSWYEAHPDEEAPDFGVFNGEVLQGNSFDLLDYVTKMADHRQLYVSPLQFAQAITEAWAIKSDGKDEWIKGMKDLVNKGITYQTQNPNV